MSCLSHFRVTFAPYVRRGERGRGTTGPFGQRNPGPLRGNRAGKLRFPGVRTPGEAGR
jgi:hypothetical protein